MSRVGEWFGVAAMALLLPVASHSQSVRSTLIISEAGVPAANARVWLTTSRGMIVDSTRSDAQGRFTVSAPRAGHYVLDVRRMGYFPEQTDPIRLREDEVVTDTVFLLSARVLQPVDVVVRREVNFRFGVDIRSLSGSNVITPEEIDRFRPAASTLDDLLRWNRPPSLSVFRNRDGSNCYSLRMRGCAPIYVDGLLWGGDAWLPASEVQSIVVIPGSEAYIRFGSANGAIVVFTNLSADRR